MSININWRIKILAKIILHRLPVDYNFWRKLSLFKHGGMENFNIASETYFSYAEIYKNLGNSLNDDTVMLEFGCGDSVFSGLLAKADGVGKSILVDVGPFAVKDVDIYTREKDKINFASESVYLHDNDTFENLLKKNNIQYLTNGLKSLKGIENNSVDYIWSNAVLEHVRKNEFQDVLFEFRRIIKDDGILAHIVDLRDHLSRGLQNLRFSEEKWEADWFAFQSGFYTNRIRFNEMLTMIQQSGFDYEVEILEKWTELPLKLKKMDGRFKNLATNDLEVAVFKIIMKPV